jgi:glycosyltransferase involved in cell wall biosynthesis
MSAPKVCVVMPCYRVGASVLNVIRAIGEEVTHIYVIDDACPAKTGDEVEAACKDKRVKVLRHERNQGVGGAVITGYKQAIEDTCDIVVKIDGDGQMAPGLIPRFIRPIAEGQADYTKGNRFFFLGSSATMPAVRLFGNVALSFMSKASSGYWSVFDPTNGYTAIHAKVLAHLPLDKIAKDYFFETDMLFRLGTMRAVVHDIPMDSTYDDEKSNLSVSSVVLSFLSGNLLNLVKRLFYNYLLRDFQLPSIAILLGLPLVIFGTLFGALHWAIGSLQGVLASPGTVMLASLPILIGTHLLIMGISHDVQNQPDRPIHPYL